MDQKPSGPFPFPDMRSAPATDLSSLEGLGKDEIRAWALRRSEEYRLLSYAVLSLYNDAAPIHALPVELLMKIFGMTWSSKGLQGLYPTAVCRRWRTLYLSTRAFWAEAVAGLCFEGHGDNWAWNQGMVEERRASPKLVAMLLDRSSSYPIKLRVDQASYGMENPAPPADTCILPSMVLPHLNHVVKFCLHMTLPHLHDLYQILNTGIPTLEVLFIHAKGREPPNLAHAVASLRPVADESLPKLYHLHVDPAIFFPLIAVRSLRGVTLSAFQDMTENDTVPSWPHPADSESRSLLWALSHCQNLEYLIIGAFEFSRWWPPLEYGRWPGTVQIPSLKWFRLGNNRPGIRLPCAQAVLAVLDPCFPPTASVDCRVLDSSMPDSLSSVMPPYLVQHHPFDAVLLSSLGSAWNILCFAVQSLRLHTSFKSPKTLAELGIEEVFRGGAVTHLKIIVDSEPFSIASAIEPVRDWAGVLRAFPRLTHLTVSGPDISSGVVDALGAVIGDGTQTTAHSEVPASASLLCPALRYMTLGWEVPREIGPKELIRTCDPASYRQQRDDLGPHVERKCVAMQRAFERRVAMKARQLDALEFYEYERQGWGREPFGRTAQFAELIISSRRDDHDLPCLERLRAVVGGRVVYRGYLLKMVKDRWSSTL